MKFKNSWKNQKWFAYTVAVCSGVVLYLALSNLGFYWKTIQGLLKVLNPVIMGIVFAYIMNPISILFEKRVFGKLKSETLAHTLGIVCSTVAVVLFVTVLLIALIPQLIQSIAALLSQAGSYPKVIQGLLNDLSDFAEDRGFDISQVVDMGYGYLNEWLSELPEKLSNILTASYNFGVAIFNVALAFMLAIYFLAAKETLIEGFKKLFKAFLTPKSYTAMAEFWGECHKILIRYITFSLIDGMIVGFCNFIYMSILSLPYAVLISFVVAVTNLAPTFGPIAGGAIGAFILVLSDPIAALLFVIFTLIIQLIDGYVLKPRLFGSSLGVPAVWILVTIIVGGNLFGVLGILFAIPFAAILTYAYRNIIEDRLEEQRLIRERDEKDKEKRKKRADKAAENATEYWD